MPDTGHGYVSRGGLKLAQALDTFAIDPAERVCADLGCSTGGFTDVLLRRGAARVYAVDTGYGVLDWRLRNDPRVVVMERTSAMHVSLPEAVSLVTIDAGWTPQAKLLPNVRKLIAPGGEVITLIKPHYEATARPPASADHSLTSRPSPSRDDQQADSTLKLQKTRGVLPPEQLEGVLARVRCDITAAGFRIIAQTPSPLRGSGTRGNIEVFAHLRLCAGQKPPSDTEIRGPSGFVAHATADTT